jgi:hypothetical protein
LYKNQKWVIQTDKGFAETVIIEKVMKGKDDEVERCRASENPTIISKACSITEKGAYTHFLFLFFYIYIWGFRIFKSGRNITADYVSPGGEIAGSVELVDRLNKEKPLDEYDDVLIKNFFVDEILGWGEKDHVFLNYEKNTLLDQYQNDAVAYFDASLYTDDFGKFTRMDFWKHSADVLAYYFCYDKTVLKEIHEVYRKVALKNGKMIDSQKKLLDLLAEVWENVEPPELLESIEPEEEIAEEADWDFRHEKHVLTEEDIDEDLPEDIDEDLPPEESDFEGYLGRLRKLGLKPYQHWSDYGRFDRDFDDFDTFKEYFEEVYGTRGKIWEQEQRGRPDYEKPFYKKPLGRWSKSESPNPWLNIETCSICFRSSAIVNEKCPFCGSERGDFFLDGEPEDLDKILDGRDSHLSYPKFDIRDLYKRFDDNRNEWVNGLNRIEEIRFIRNKMCRTAPKDIPDYDSMTVAKLRAVLKKSGQPVSGRKDELLSRIREYQYEKYQECFKNIAEVLMIYYGKAMDKNQTPPYELIAKYSLEGISIEFVENVFKNQIRFFKEKGVKDYVTGVRFFLDGTVIFEAMDVFDHLDDVFDHISEFPPARISRLNLECPDCKGTHIKHDYDHAELVCVECGSVIDSD